MVWSTTIGCYHTKLIEVNLHIIPSCSILFNIGLESNIIDEIDQLWYYIVIRNAKGKFKFNIKQLKVGTKFKLTATSPLNKNKATINYANNQFSIPVSNLSAGYITLTVYNKFKQELISLSVRVYLSDRVSIGMSAAQVLQTTYGQPSTINRYYGGALEQWVYRFKWRTVYLYLQNGVVTSFSEIG